MRLRRRRLALDFFGSASATVARAGAMIEVEVADNGPRSAPAAAAMEGNWAFAEARLGSSATANSPGMIMSSCEKSISPPVPATVLAHVEATLSASGENASVVGIQLDSASAVVVKKVSASGCTPLKNVSLLVLVAVALFKLATKGSCDVVGQNEAGGCVETASTKEGGSGTVGEACVAWLPRLLCLVVVVLVLCDGAPPKRLVGKARGLLRPKSSSSPGSWSPRWSMAVDLAHAPEAAPCSGMPSMSRKGTADGSDQSKNPLCKAGLSEPMVDSSAVHTLGNWSTVVLSGWLRRNCMMVAEARAWLDVIATGTPRAACVDASELAWCCC